jgi:hypothetical protein
MSCFDIQRRLKVSNNCVSRYAQHDGAKHNDKIYVQIITSKNETCFYEVVIWEIKRSDATSTTPRSNEDTARNHRFA